MILKIFGVEYDELFDVINVSKKNEKLGTFIITKDEECKFKVMKIKDNGNHCKIQDNALGMLILGVLRNTVMIKSLGFNLNNVINDYKIPTYNYRLHRIHNCPIYVNSVTSIDEKHVIVEYVTIDEKIRTDIYTKYHTGAVAYFKFGKGYNIIYEGYKGPLILKKIPEEHYELVQSIASKYGTMVCK